MLVKEQREIEGEGKDKGRKEVDVQVRTVYDFEARSGGSGGFGLDGICMRGTLDGM